MSAQCTNCPHIFKEDFGLVTCPDCGHTGFIDLDGEFTTQSNEVATENEVQHDHLEPVETFEDLEELASNEAQLEMSSPDSNLSLENSEPTFDEILNTGDIEDIEDPLEADALVSDFVASPESILSDSAEVDELDDHKALSQVESQTHFEDVETVEQQPATLAGHEAPAAKAGSNEALAFLKNIDEFSQLDAGLFTAGEHIYELQVKGILDTDLNDICVELAGSRLGLGTEEDIKALFQIKTSSLRFKPLTRVQLAICVRRLTAFKCQLDWTQIEIYEEEFQAESIDAEDPDLAL